MKTYEIKIIGRGTLKEIAKNLTTAAEMINKNITPVTNSILTISIYEPQPPGKIPGLTPMAEPKIL